ncbi:MAG: SDR family oxidoreductase [Cyanobacteria bacterium SZAS-4]|nr:SDR family oxidoreductase [Cyanobacteria bacterium SZAS-4]
MCQISVIFDYQYFRQEQFLPFTFTIRSPHLSTVQDTAKSVQKIPNLKKEIVTDSIVQSQSSPVYIILGASGGIGSVLARKLNCEAKLILAGRNSDALKLLADSLGCNYEVGDCTSFSDVDRIVQTVTSDFGRLDGIVNCVGSLLLKPAHRTTESDWQQTMNTNLSSAFACVRSGASSMMDTGGSIVLISSSAATVGLLNHEAIAAAKAGIIGLTKSAATTYARNDIRVNCVAPGLIETPLTARITSNEMSRAASLGMQAIKRLGQPIDVVSAITWLLSNNASWVTGQCICVDGGLSSTKNATPLKISHEA